MDGRVWVANGRDQTVSVLDEATGKKLTDIAFETGVHGVGEADGSVWVLDLHGPGPGEDLGGTTIWRFDPATAAQ